MTSRDLPRPESTDGAAELKELVLQAGLEVLTRDGFAMRPESISYKRVFAHLKENYGIRITRGSVHERIWANQDEFQFDVLLKVIEESTAVQLMAPDEAEQDMGTGRSAASMVAEIQSARRLRESGLDGHELLQAWCQESGARQSDLLANWAALSQQQGLKAVARAAPDGVQRARMFEALNRRDIDGFESSRSGTARLLAELGLRPKSGLGLGEATSMVILGSCLRALSAAAVLDYHTGLDGLVEPLPTSKSDNGPAWTRFGIAKWALYRFLFEPEDADSLAERRRKAEPLAGMKPVEGPRAMVTPEMLRHRIGLRRPRAQLKELVLAAGGEVIARDGLDLSPVSLTYAATFDRIEEQFGFRVNRSSVHRRFWASQRDFRNEVLRRAIVLDPHDFYSRMASALSDDAEREPIGGLSGPVRALDRAVEWSERLRRLALRVQYVVGDDPDYARRQIVRAAVLAGTDADDAESIRMSATSAGYDGLSMFVKLSTERLAVEGFRENDQLPLRRHEVHETFTIVVSSLIAGLDFNIFAGLTLAGATVELPDRADPTRTESWNLLGIGARAVLEHLFIPPDL